MTKQHRLGGLNNKHFLTIFLEAGKSKISVLADSVLAEGPFPSLYTAFFSLWAHTALPRSMCACVVVCVWRKREGDGERGVSSSFYKGTNPIIRSPFSRPNLN